MWQIALTFPYLKKKLFHYLRKRWFFPSAKRFGCCFSFFYLRSGIIFHLKRHPIEEKNCQMVNVKNKQSSHDKKKSFEEDVRVMTFPYLKKNVFIIYGRNGSSNRPKDLGVVSASFILVPVCSSREKKEFTALLQSSHDKKKSFEEDVRVILRELVKLDPWTENDGRVLTNFEGIS
jgi:hypothetical protein